MTNLRASLFAAASLVLLAACGAPESRPGGPDVPSGPAPVTEAGYLDVPAAVGAGPAYPARMFYSFHPADGDPRKAPLLLLFNGGSGAATTGGLAVFGTGPMTLDPADPLDAPPRKNADSFTRFANLLYVDERQAGFSYGLKGAWAQDCEGGEIPYLHDAADYTLALLDFLDAHPGIRRNPVVLVGESYGGTRAALVLHLLQHYAVPADPPIDGLPDLAVRVPWLRERVQRHFDESFPESAGEVRGPEEVAAQFGSQVLIEPSVAGHVQFQVQEPLLAADPLFQPFFASYGTPGKLDPYDVRRTEAEGVRIDEHAAAVLRDRSRLQAVLGVDPAGIAGLPAAERGAAFRALNYYDPAQLEHDEANLRGALGEPASGDAYWLPLAPACGNPMSGDSVTANVFARLLRGTRTFITNARYDSVVYGPGIPALLGGGTWQVTWDQDAPAGAARPGLIRLHAEDFDARIRFPTYEAGHMVAQTAGPALREDVEAWLGEQGLLAE